MNDWREILKDFDIQRLWEDETTAQTREITEAIAEWLKEEEDKQNWIEENLRNENDLGE